MSDSLRIADDHVVTIHYSLKLDTGGEIDSSTGRDPLLYLHGHGNIVPGLETHLAGCGVGEKVEVTVAPEDGYGVIDPGRVHDVPRSQFPADAEIQPGMQFGARDDQGNTVPVWVDAVNDANVTVNFNHPLAGQNLHFAVEVMEVRKATDAELQHGHPHGPGGHQH